MKLSFGFARLFYLGVTAVFFVGVPLIAEESKDDLQKLVVRLDKPSPVADAARAALSDSLAEVKPRIKALPQSLVTKSGRYIVHGDLFKTGGCFAILELSLKTESDAQYGSEYVALAEWIAAKWDLRGLWNIPSTWRPKGWKSSGDDYLPTTPATQPFDLRDLSADGVPEVIIAGEVEKYFQAHYLLRFDPKTRGLALLEYAMGKPELVGKHVQLYFNSGRRAIYEEWEYLRLVSDKLVRKASWHDEVPYNNVDPHFIIADVAGGDGRSHSFRITDADSDSENESAYTLTKDDKPYATVVVVWRETLVKNVNLTPSEVEQAWLFEKITGLPRNLYPSPRCDKKLERLEDHATVRVTGSDEVIQRFSLKPIRR